MLQVPRTPKCPEIPSGSACAPNTGVHRQKEVWEEGPPKGRTGPGLEEKGIGPGLPYGPLLGEQTQPRPPGALSDPTMKGSVDG